MARLFSRSLAVFRLCGLLLLPGRLDGEADDCRWLGRSLDGKKRSKSQSLRRIASSFSEPFDAVELDETVVAIDEDDLFSFFYLFQGLLYIN
jgi:hypothetical protein